MDDRIFACIMPAGISYTDRTREEHGDYKRLAFLPFRTLSLEFRPDCSRSDREEIARDAAEIQKRRGEAYPVSTSGQTVILGA